MGNYYQGPISILPRKIIIKGSKMLDFIENKKIRPVGRPKIPDEFKKKHRTVKLRDETWGLLYTIGGGNRARAIEELVEGYFDYLRDILGKKKTN